MNKEKLFAFIYKYIYHVPYFVKFKMNVNVSPLIIIEKLKELSYRCTVLVLLFCSVERDTHRYFLLDQTNHRETSRRSLSAIQRVQR